MDIKEIKESTRRMQDFFGLNTKRERVKHQKYVEKYVL